MKLADEIQKLEVLRQNGTLSKEEFDRAKAAILAGADTAPPAAPPSAVPPVVQKRSGFLDPRANMRALVRIAIILLILVAGVWFLIRQTAGRKAANQLVATVAHTPVTLHDVTENVVASSWKALALNLPYSGSVSISLSVVQGNPVDVLVLSPENLEKFKTKTSFQHFGTFEATQTKNYVRSGRLRQGDYYLVISDKTLGILSASASDVKVTVRLEP